MRARFVRSRGRATTRGRYFVPLSATAVVALAAGTLVAVNPLSDGNNVGLTQSGMSFEAGAGAEAGAGYTVGQEYTIALSQLFDLEGEFKWLADAAEITVTGLPEGMTFDQEAKAIVGTPTQAGSFEVSFTVGDQTATSTIEIGAEGEAGGNGTIDTSSLGEDSPLQGALTAVLGSLGITGEAAANSTGNAGGDVPGDTDTQTGSVPIDVEALLNGATGSTGDTEVPDTTTEGELGGEGTGEVAVQSSGSSIPGGSVSDLVPFLTISGALLLGLAAAGALGAGSSVPGGGLTAGSNGSTTTGGNDTGSTGSSNTKSERPAPKTETPKAPGPEVNNGRG